MTQLVIIGAGAHAAEIDEYIQSAIVRYNALIDLVGVLDDNPESYPKYRFNAPFLGKISNHQIRSDVSYVMGIAGMNARNNVLTKFIDAGAKFFTFIHPDTLISASATIGDGVIVAPGVVIGPNVKIGDHNLINGRAGLGHDTILGDNNIVGPNVSFSGFTKIIDRNMFGMNSGTIPGIQIGSSNTIAAGMILDKNVGDDTTVFYRFKEKVIAIPKV